MASNVQQFDVASSQNLLNAFNTARGEVESAAKSVTNVHQDVSSAWLGQAASKFTGEMEEWLSGLSQVLSGIEELGTSMTHIHGLRTQVEDANSQLVAGSAGSPMGAVSPSIGTPMGQTGTASWT
jgi:WXG100 family type VII secretion target